MLQLRRSVQVSDGCKPANATCGTSAQSDCVPRKQHSVMVPQRVTPAAAITHGVHTNQALDVETSRSVPAARRSILLSSAAALASPTISFVAPPIGCAKDAEAKPAGLLARLTGLRGSLGGSRSPAAGTGSSAAAAPAGSPSEALTTTTQPVAERVQADNSANTRSVELPEPGQQDPQQQQEEAAGNAAGDNSDSDSDSDAVADDDDSSSSSSSDDEQELQQMYDSSDGPGQQQQEQQQQQQEEASSRGDSGLQSSSLEVDSPAAAKQGGSSPSAGSSSGTSGSSTQPDSSNSTDPAGGSSSGSSSSSSTLHDSNTAADQNSRSSTSYPDNGKSSMRATGSNGASSSNNSASSRNNSASNSSNGASSSKTGKAVSANLSVQAYLQILQESRRASWPIIAQKISAGDWIALSQVLVQPPFDDVRQACFYIPWALLQSDDFTAAVAARKAFVDFIDHVHALATIALKADDEVPGAAVQVQQSFLLLNASVDAYLSAVPKKYR